MELERACQLDMMPPEVWEIGGYDIHKTGWYPLFHKEEVEGVGTGYEVRWVRHSLPQGVVLDRIILRYMKGKVHLWNMPWEKGKPCQWVRTMGEVSYQDFMDAGRRFPQED